MRSPGFRVSGKPTPFLENASIFENYADGCMHSLRSHTYPSEKRKN